MASIQYRFLRNAIRTARQTFYTRARIRNVKLLRRGMETMAKRHWLPKHLFFKRFYIDDLPAAWINPKEFETNNVLYYLHGGGYLMGSINTHKTLIAQIARESRVKALAIDYRLAPENPFPAAVEDALKGYLWLLDQGYRPENIVIAGDSAGGGLALATLHNIKAKGHPMPACAVCLSPWSDLSGTGSSMASKVKADPLLIPSEILKWGKLYAGEQDRKQPLLSPLYGDFTGFPPLLIQVGSAEIIMDDSVRVAEKAKEAGVDVILDVWEDMLHVWQYYWRYIPEGKKAIRKIGTYIRGRVGVEREESFK